MRQLRVILSKSRQSWLCACVVALGVGIVANPRAQTTPQQRPPGDENAANQSATFRVGVTLVRTDVIVRDENGMFVPDLTPDDFRIEEDGVPQEIASLVLVHGGRVFTQLTPPAPVQEGIVLPTRRVENDTAGRIIIFFIDALHLQPEITPKVRHFIKKVADVLVHEGDLVGLISNGTSSNAVDFTYDRAALYSAVDHIIGSGFSPRDLITAMQEGPNGPAELRWRAHRAFRTVNLLIENLESIVDRRKVLIYISTGYDLNPFALQRLNRDNAPSRDLRDRPIDLADGAGFDPEVDDVFGKVERQGGVFADGELIAELTELTQAANRANTTFYTMDPRGLISSPDLDYDVPFEAWREYMSTTRSSLRSLAELTGGISIVNTNNLNALLRKIDAETSDYYVVGFYTNNPDPTHRTRQLAVSVNRDAVTVQSRTSYTFSRTAVQTP
ncbi:MAG: VWA domain-containing protein [Acidobacteria bacterium]|nr:MAG: VWA domain-containing protein [Acidobacteriota bacterium]